MNSKNLNIRRQDRVGWIEYQRPPVNAINWEMLQEIPAALEELLGDANVRVIVFASAIEKYFSVGADLKLFESLGQDGMRKWMTLCHDLVRKMRHSSKPLLAAIHGTAVGAGFEAVLHCDVRFAASDARIGQPEVNIGLLPGVGTTQSLARLLGRTHAIRFLYEGALVSAEEAATIGLVDIVYPRDRLRDEVQGYARALADKPAKCLAAIRRTITLGGSVAFDEGLKMEYDAEVELAGTRDFEEGIRAFLEKRPPRWE
ncbi:MAG: enoyl-CoA hydratase/isomerase family protein [Acidiferrobacterales bacterium]